MFKKLPKIRKMGQKYWIWAIAQSCHFGKYQTAGQQYRFGTPHALSKQDQSIDCCDAHSWILQRSQQVDSVWTL